MSYILSFDIGHASIGWCVLESQADRRSEPRFLGTGVVTFQTDSCLASQRRALRRMRRHIRSTRMRVERIRKWLIHRGVLRVEDAEKEGHAAPFWLASGPLAGKRTLSGWELWTVIRWYAHNRGYDGNSLWARGEEDPEDTEKQKAARALMAQHPETGTMAETVCKCLGVDAESDKWSSHKPYKTLNAAFPRNIVTEEVGKIMRLHMGVIPGVDLKTIRLLLTDSELQEEDRNELAKAGIRLSKRYHGGLLFGQHVPRFDNRIISRCPITWASEYDKAIEAGMSEASAGQMADKFAKVPGAKCSEFLEYRFSRVIANIRSEGKPLPGDLRRHLFGVAKERGRLTAAELIKEIEAGLGSTQTNLEAYFNLHPDADRQLVIDPAKAVAITNRIIRAMWPHLGDACRKQATSLWGRGREIRPAELIQMAEDGGDARAAEESLKALFDKLAKKVGRTQSWSEFLMKPIAAGYDAGRAPYARPVLKKVVDEVLDGFDPTRSAVDDEDTFGRRKEEDGVLYPLMDPGSRARRIIENRPLDHLTNNHLVRHRLLILGRLLDDMIDEFGVNGGDIRVVVEVARELKEFSGMTAKQITSELNSRLKDFKDAVAHLKKHAPHLLLDSGGRGGLIRKCRIAIDLGWRCPFTGDHYDVSDLSKLEREHIIPYSARNSNSLHALVLTWPEVNRMKGKRTARQFIDESASLPSRQVPGLARLCLFTPKQYEDFVTALDARGHPDDVRRKKARKALLMTTDIADKGLGFTEGQLTQSSQLMKLAMGQIKQKLALASVDAVPGPVTAEIRKSWRLAGTLALVCPKILDSDGKVRPKDEIRELTHMHHALDAATLGLAAHYIPFQFSGLDQKGKIWQALLKRNQTDAEKEFLLSLGCCAAYSKNGEVNGTHVGLRDLSAKLKDELARSLAESRVMQHVPADRSGVRAELTTWGVVAVDGEGDNARVTIRQRSSTVESGVRKIAQKQTEERAGKLLGIAPVNGTGKLKDIKGVMVIGDNYGIALDPEPCIIPFHQVSRRLEEIRAHNSGRMPRVLRNGMLISVSDWPGKNGLWRIFSCKASMKLDLGRPHDVRATWREVSIKSLLSRGMSIVAKGLTGMPSKSVK